MISTETKVINGTTYQVSQLPYGRGHKLLLRLFRVLGPAIAKAFGQAGQQELGNMQVGSLVPAVEQLATDLSEDDFDYVVEELASASFIVKDTGHQLRLDSGTRELHFAGNYLELFQWLAFALKVNFGGFIKGRDLVSEVLARTQQQASPSPSGSTGQPTGSPAPVSTAPG